MKRKHQEWQDRQDSRLFIGTFLCLAAGMGWSGYVTTNAGGPGWMLGIAGLCCAFVAYGETRTRYTGWTQVDTSHD